MPWDGAPLPGWTHFGRFARRSLVVVELVLPVIIMPHRPCLMPEIGSVGRRFFEEAMRIMGRATHPLTLSRTSESIPDCYSSHLFLLSPP